MEFSMRRTTSPDGRKYGLRFRCVNHGDFKFKKWMPESTRKLDSFDLLGALLLFEATNPTGLGTPLMVMSLWTLCLLC
jgi:hypothetical protein